MLQVPWNTVALQNCETATANSGTTVTQKIEQHHWKTTQCKTRAPCCKDALQCSSALATTCVLSQVHQGPKFSTLLRKRKMGTWSMWTGRVFPIWCSSEKRKRKVAQYGKKIKSWSIWTKDKKLVNMDTGDLHLMKYESEWHWCCSFQRKVI